MPYSLSPWTRDLSQGPCHRIFSFIFNKLTIENEYSAPYWRAMPRQKSGTPQSVAGFAQHSQADDPSESPAHQLNATGQNAPSFS
ncbi:hypothetical protein [Aquipseudomonas campi]